MHKREFLKLAAGTGASILASRYLRGSAPAPPQTYVYKTAGGCDLKADVYGADPSLRKRPFSGFMAELSFSDRARLLPNG